MGQVIQNLTYYTRIYLKAILFMIIAFKALSRQECSQDRSNRRTRSKKSFSVSDLKASKKNTPTALLCLQVVHVFFRFFILSVLSASLQTTRHKPNHIQQPVAVVNIIFVSHYINCVIPTGKEKRIQA